MNPGEYLGDLIGELYIVRESYHLNAYVIWRTGEFIGWKGADKWHFFYGSHPAVDSFLIDGHERSIQDVFDEVDLSPGRFINFLPRGGIMLYHEEKSASFFKERFFFLWQAQSSDFDIEFKAQMLKTLTPHARKPCLHAYLCEADI